MKLALGVLAAAMVLALAGAAQARVVDLASGPPIAHIDGQMADDHAGAAVAAAGDVNGDGRRDVILGAPDADNNGRTDSGSAYVVYGGNNPAKVDLQQLGGAGFRIDGASAGDAVGLSVAGAGDLNRDGIDDVLVGAPFSDQPVSAAGSVYVIYGQRTADLADLDLVTVKTTASARGLRLQGTTGSDNFGTSVATAGDVNGDGQPDVVLAAPFASNNGRTVSGSVYVLYGGNGLAGIDLANLGSNGFRVDGAEEDDLLGVEAVAGTGDFNGDDIGDVIFGSIHSGADVGAAYVIYGRSAAMPSNIDLASIATTQAQLGMLISGAAAGDLAGWAVSGGDLNGDGRADAVVSAPNASDASGDTYVVYGQATADPADVPLAALTGAQAVRGMRITGTIDSNSGSALDATGDLNGDGTADLLVGAPADEEGGRDGSGAAFLVAGQATTDPSDLSLGEVRTDPSLVRISGAGSFDSAGSAVAASGDLDGDGHPDAIVGSPGAINNGRFASGSVDVLDLGGPETTLDPAPSLTNDPTPTLSFHASEPASFLCSFDTGGLLLMPCSGPGGTDTPTAPLADGTHAFRVAAVDVFGNLDPTPATTAFTVDSTAPDTKLTRHPRRMLATAKGAKKARARFGFRSTEQGATFSCRLDKRRPRPCTSPQALRLKRGRHTFTVTATDRAGNSDSTPARFKLKVIPPRKRRPM